MANQVVRLSASQISMFLRCPRQWAFRYREGLKLPPSGAMKQGGVFHSTAERNYRQKATTQTDLPLDEQTDFFAETWEKELQREEVTFNEGDSAASLKDQGTEIVHAHHTVLAPNIFPLSAESVEEKIVLPLAKDEVQYELVAVLDLTDQGGIIRDNKAMTRTPNQADLDRDIQLSTYALAKRMQTRQPEAGLALDIVIKNKAPKALTMTTTRSREQLILHLKDTIGHVAKAIRAEAFPANPTSPLCSPKWCGYANRCVWGSMPKHIDLGANNLREQLNASIKQARTEKADLGVVSVGALNGSDSSACGAIESRGALAPTGPDTQDQSGSNETGV